MDGTNFVENSAALVAAESTSSYSNPWSDSQPILAIMIARFAYQAAFQVVLPPNAVVN